MDEVYRQGGQTFLTPSRGLIRRLLPGFVPPDENTIVSKVSARMAPARFDVEAGFDKSGPRGVVSPLGLLPRIRIRLDAGGWMMVSATSHYFQDDANRSGAWFGSGTGRIRVPPACCSTTAQ